MANVADSIVIDNNGIMGFTIGPAEEIVFKALVYWPEVRPATPTGIVWGYHVDLSEGMTS